MNDFIFNFTPEYMPRLLYGVIVTLQVTIASFAGGIVLGLCLALARISTIGPARVLARIYVDVIRGIPLIVFLLFLYFSLPTIGISLPAFWAGVLGLSMNLGAYLSEVFRSAIQAISPGQREASLSLGLSTTKTYRLVILPQAFAIALPTIGGYFIGLLKESALVSYISVEELLRTGTEIIGETFRSMETYALIGIIYLILSYVAAYVVVWMEAAIRPKYLSEEKKGKSWKWLKAYS